MNESYKMWNIEIPRNYFESVVILGRSSLSPQRIEALRRRVLRGSVAMKRCVSSTSWIAEAMARDFELRFLRERVLYGEERGGFISLFNHLYFNEPSECEPMMKHGLEIEREIKEQADIQYDILRHWWRAYAFTAKDKIAQGFGNE